MTTSVPAYAVRETGAKEQILSRLAQSDLHADLLYADLHGGVPGRPGELRPLEKRLIGFSLGIGLFLLTVLIIINHLFPVTP